MKKQIALIIISMLAAMTANAQNVNEKEVCNLNNRYCGKDYGLCVNQCFLPCYGLNGCALPDFDFPKPPYFPEDDFQKPDDGNINQDNTNQENTNQDNSSQMPQQNAMTTQVLQLVNEERARQGLETLVYDSELAQASYIRAVEIKKLFSHTRPNGSKWYTVLGERGYDYSGAGENVAYGQENAREVFEAWMNSEGHRENILNPLYTNIGIAVHQSDTLYWCQLFAY